MKLVSVSCMCYIKYMVSCLFRTFGAALLLLIAALPAQADGFKDRFSWSINGGLLYFAADNGQQGADPAPILPSLGAAACLNIWGPLGVELSEDLYFYNYEYNADKKYAMACNPENRSAFVFGFLTGLQARAIFPLGKNGIDIRAYLGPAADIRIVTLAFGLNHPDDFTDKIETDAQMQTDAIRDYFWSEGRWLFCTTGAGLDFPVNEKFKLGFDTRIWLPFYRLWTDEDLPAIDGWRFGLGFRITPR